MIVRFVDDGMWLLVTREDGDKRITRSGWSPNAGMESSLLYRVQAKLKEQGTDVIKKLMWEDGHMVSDDIYYLRTRNMNDETGMMIWNGNHQVYDAGEDYNKTGEIALRVDRWGNG